MPTGPLQLSHELALSDTFVRRECIDIATLGRGCRQAGDSKHLLGVIGPCPWEMDVFNDLAVKRTFWGHSNDTVATCDSRQDLSEKGWSYCALVLTIILYNAPRSRHPYQAPSE